MTWLLWGLGACVAVAALAVGVHEWRWVAYHHHKGLSVPGSAWRAAWVEVVPLGWIGWWAVRGFLRDALWRPAVSRGRPVLCVHGYTQNATNFWGLRRRLFRAGRASVGISLRHRLAPVGWYAARLEAEMARLLREEPEGIDVVAHSMGGVLLRVVLARRPDLAAGVHRVVTLGSPHAGTAGARGVPWLPEVRALKRSSPLLRELPELPELLGPGAVSTFAGTLDTVVYPVSSALAEGAAQRRFPVGHAGLLTDDEVLAAVTRALR